VKKKSLALVLALALMVVGAVGGTLAWLTAKSDVVTNTFTTSNIKVELKETQGETVEGGREFKMIPGYAISKDPKARVLPGSEECFLFVKLDKAANFDNFLTYEMANDWTKLEGVTDTVYYREVLTADMDKAYSVLKNDQVTVKGDVTKEQMNDMDAGKIAKPTLTITAYAFQLYKSAGVKFSAKEAWDNITTK